MSDFKARLAALPPEKRKVLLEQLRKKREKARREIPPQPRGNPFPLSFAQERMWFLQQLDPASAQYNVSVTICFSGTLDVERLKASLEVLARRHEALRTTFRSLAGQPRQAIAEAGTPSLEIVDVRGTDAADARFYELGEAALRSPFDLENGPLTRWHLYRLAEDEARLLVVMHHIVSDGWSLGVLTRELATVYRALAAGEAVRLPPLPVQCADFAVWQREWLQGKTLDRLLAYWEERLADAPQMLELPTDHPRPAERRGIGERAPFQLPDESYIALKRLTQAEGVTPFMALFAAFATLLMRLTGQEDLVIGVPINNRTNAQIVGVVGAFVNTLALRVDLSGHLTYRELVQQVRQAALDGYAHQDLPFARLVDALQIERSLSHSPLFQVSFGVQDNPVEAIEMPGLKVSLLEVRSLLEEHALPPLHTGRSMFDLTFHLSEIAEGIGGWIEYDAELFEADTVARLARQFTTLLTACLRDPATRVGDVPLLTAGERAQLAAWNDTARPREGPATLHERFTASATEHAERIAVREVRDFVDLYDALESGAPAESEVLDAARWECNPFLFIYPPEQATRMGREIGVTEAEFKAGHVLVRTHRHTVSLVNGTLWALLQQLDGARSTASLEQALRDEETHFELYTFAPPREAEDAAPRFTHRDFNVNEIRPLLQALYQDHLIRVSSFAPADEPAQPLSLRPAPPELPAWPSLPQEDGNSAVEARSPILLLGAGPGPATTGLIYLAAYLRRHGIEAYCQYNDPHRSKHALQENIRHLLDTIQPEVVGVSIKWFPHIARGLEICRVVKEHAPETMVVIGGDSASYFHEYLIEEPHVDALIRGDGSLPLLKLLRGDEDIPNLVRKDADGVQVTAMDYVRTEQNAAENYLSHLDEIFVGTADYFAPYIFIYTGQGCSMDCFYCAGARENQKRVFNRDCPYLRPVEVVRRDIAWAMRYTPMLMFDFDLPLYNSQTYYQQLWSGFDLSQHFVHFYFWKLPNADFIALVSETFKYVYLNIDMCSLSERHRLKLVEMGVVKPQPTDEELLAFFDIAEHFPNVEVTINLISGLPFFDEEDIAQSEAMLEYLTTHYTCLAGLDWGRLHAQPGAPLTADYAGFEMQESALAYEDYRAASDANLEPDIYPDAGSLNYPLVYYRDGRLNSVVSKHYADTSTRMARYLAQLRRRVRFQSHDMNYRELDARANQLAHYLREMGVGPEKLVGICVERSAAMIIAALGVLKAGGGYVPLDPAYPEARLGCMIEDAGLTVLLTQTSWLTQLPELDVPVVCLARDAARIAAAPETPVDVTVRPDNVAYVIYTSGSTGVPKGVAVTHRSIVNLVEAQIREFALEPDSRALQFASFSFDAAVSEIFTTLISGAMLVLPASQGNVVGDDLAALLREQRISTVTLPPSISTMLRGDRFPEVRTLISAGEACHREVVARWRAGRRLLNFYGPTEATVGCAREVVSERAFGDAQTVPIGTPIENVRLYVVDEWLNAVPVGVSGELVVGGVALARGYLHRPAMTAEKFAPDPFSEEPGARLYRTGDLVRRLPDGRLEFLGRIDNQVKLRGYRIELEEIAVILSEHPAILESVATVYAGEDGRAQLVVYFVPAGDAPSLDVVREYLQARLPDYMIPGVFVPLERWPLTPNGKIDRGALPAPEAALRLASSHDFVAPRTPTETALAEIWAALLGVEQVGIHDNFFELGGDSILSIQMVTQAREAGLELNPRQIFQHQTVATLASVVGSAQRIVAEQEAVVGPVPLTPIQRWFFDQAFASLPHWNQAVMLSVPSGLDAEALRDAVRVLLTHHDALRLRFERGDAGWAQVNAPPDSVEPFAVVSLAGSDQIETALAAHARQIQAEFDLAEGPLLRVVYYDLGAGRGARLLLAAHHLVVDAVSWRILIEDLRTAYEQIARGGEVHLPEKTTSYRRWAREMAAYARSDALAEQADLWSAMGQGAQTPLPVDFPGGLDDNREATTRSLTWEFTREKTEALLEAVPEVYNTQLQDVLLAALLWAMSRWTGKLALWVDLEGHGRVPLWDHLDVSRTVGWFTCTYPVLLSADAGDPDALLIAVKEQMRGIPEGGIGYGLLRYSREDDIGAQVRAMLAPQIGFNYLGRIARGEGEWTLRPDADVGPVRAPEARRSHLLEVEGRVRDGRLHITWHYSDRVHREETVASLVAWYAEALESFIAHCRGGQEIKYTPSDFPEAELTQHELDGVLEELFG